MTEDTDKLPKNIEQIESVGKPWKEGGENISWDQICFVRALNDERSIQVSEGEIVLPTISTLTKGDIPRYTNHWAVNHLVESHGFGSWATCKVVVITPARPLISENGLPENLWVTDTFWTKDMKVPKGSTVVWMGNQPKEFENTNGINQLSVTIDNQKIAEVEALQKELDSGKTGSTEQEMDLENRLIALKKTFEVNARTIINREISKIGYSVFDQEAQGIYSHEKGLDDAIVGLARQENIGSTRIHAHTLYGLLESEGYWPGPLDFLERSQTIDELEKIVEEETGKDDGFQYCLEEASRKINDEEWKWTESEKKERLIFSTELYKVLKNSLKELEKDEELRYTCAIFLEDCPEVRDIIKSWSEKDSVNLDSVLK